MPSDLTLKAMNTIHRSLLKLTGGRVGWTAGNMAVLELTTVGRKTGEKRAVMLTSPIQDGDSMLIVASRGGDDHHPAWFLNLRADPAVEVALRAKAPTPMTARIVTAEERVDLWPRITAVYKNYGGYQARTDREIPLVWLDPT